MSNSPDFAVITNFPPGAPITWVIYQSTESGLLDTLQSWAPIFVAALALCVTLWQAVLSRKHNRKMVKPHLDGLVEIDLSTGTYRYQITNNGIGPAIIIDTGVYLDGSLIKSEAPLDHAIAAISKNLLRAYPNIRTIASGSYISAAETIVVFEVQSDDPKLLERELRKRVRLVGWYESIYEERFFFDSNPPA